MVISCIVDIATASRRSKVIARESVACWAGTSLPRVRESIEAAVFSLNDDWDREWALCRLAWRREEMTFEVSCISYETQNARNE